MLRKRGQKGFTLIELLIVIAIIGILAAIAIPMYRVQTVKAKLSEVTNSMSHVASAVAAYYSEEGKWPGGAMSDTLAVKTTLGVAVPVVPTGKYIWAVNVQAGNGVIVMWATNTGDSATEGKYIVMTPSVNSQGAIRWDYSGDMPIAYLPKK